MSHCESKINNTFSYFPVLASIVVAVGVVRVGDLYFFFFVLDRSAPSSTMIVPRQ